MGLNNWRWWHWLALSIVVGAGLGLAFTSIDLTDTSAMQSTSFVNMRNKIERRTDKGDSILTQIRVGPVRLDNKGQKVQLVTYYERQHNRVTGSWDPVVQYWLATPVPLSPKSPRPDFGVLDYLKDRSQDIKTLDYKYQWWLEPRNIWIFTLGGSVLLVGLLWPLVILKLLVKLGLAEPPSERMGSLAAVKITDDSSELSTGAVVTADDRQKLDDLNAELAANVAGMTVASSNGDRKHVEEPIRLLKGDNVVEVKPMEQDKDPEDFKGEFYPVARPHAKH